MNRGTKLDSTLDVVAELLAERFDITLDEMKEIAAAVSGMADREAKYARIVELGNAIPVRRVVAAT